jgi:hypothetical protein
MHSKFVLIKPHFFAVLMGLIANGCSGSLYEIKVSTFLSLAFEEHIFQDITQSDHAFKATRLIQHDESMNS